MIVFGDHDRVENAADVLARVLDICERAKGLPRQIERHGERVRAFILAAELAQGIADRDFEAHGADVDTPAQRACARLLMHLAGLVLNKAGTAMPDKGDIERIAAQGMVRLRTGEGHAFYALYPESYSGPARQSGLGPDTRVIGIRSIGTGLAAIVAAALGGEPPVSVRPVGHPFARELRIGESLKDRVLGNGDTQFAVVDEGPGLSGSSFAAVVNWLCENGIAPERIRLFPSHGGEPGPKASAIVKKAWSLVQRHPGDKELYLGEKHEFAQWFADHTGPLDAVTDISGGEWRRLRNYPSGWPPSDRRFERRKFLLQAGGQAFLAKFAGLGEGAVAKMTAARRLGAAGLSPRPIALRHGILLEEWHCARPVDPHSDRAAWLETAARYIGFRARMLEPVNAGASAGRLIEMATHNAGVALGPDAAHCLRHILENQGRAMARTYPVHSDNRMHAWEWIVTAGGQILKSDALDHACGHDLIGCQDVAWDVAGAIVELRMDNREANAFIEEVSREAARPVDAGLLFAMTGCYLAFQLGSWTLAAQAGDEMETLRLLGEVDRYKSLLAGWIAGEASDLDLNSIFTSLAAPSSSPPMTSPTSAPAPRPPAETR